jgi:hypothetical protein
LPGAAQPGIPVGLAVRFAAGNSDSEIALKQHNGTIKVFVSVFVKGHAVHPALNGLAASLLLNPLIKHVKYLNNLLAFC